MLCNGIIGVQLGVLIIPCILGHDDVDRFIAVEYEPRERDLFTEEDVFIATYIYAANFVTAVRHNGLIKVTKSFLCYLGLIGTG